MNFLKIKDYQLEYHLTGTDHSETILFLHGLGANRSQFEAQHYFFSKKYQVLSISLCGHGNSSLPSKVTLEQFTLENLKNDVLQALDFLGIEKVHFVGNSMGGNIGLELLGKNPTRLLSLTIFGTTGQLNKSKILICLMRQVYGVLSMKTIGKLSSFAGLKKQSKIKIQEMVSVAFKRAVLHCIPNLANFDYLSDIRKSKINTLLLRGEKDSEINAVLDETIVAFQSRGNFQLKELNGVGHFMNLDDAGLFNKELYNFLRSIDGEN